MEVRHGYKQTDVGVIPDEWEVDAIGDSFDISGGFTASRDQLSSNGYCYLHYGDIHKSTKSFIDVRAEYLDIPKLDIPLSRVPSKSLLADGDVVFVDASEDDEGTSKHLVVVNPEAIPYISGLHTIVAKSKTTSFDNTYKRYCFQTPDLRRQFLFYAVGTKVSGISKTNIKKVFIPRPTIPEQTAIAAALSDVDALFGKLDQLIGKKRDLRQAAMQQLLTGQIRLPGFHGEWEVKRLGDVATIRDGTHQTPKYVASGIPFFSVEHVTSGDFKNTKFISEQEHRFLTRSFKIEKGDILMTRIGSIGDCKLIDWEVDASFYVSLALLKIKPGYSAAYIAHYSKSRSFQREVELHSLQSAIPRKINLGPISNVKIELPPTITEQTAIAEVLSDMDAELTELERRRDKTRDLKQGMMQELLTGRTRLV